jgi:hypothetical protein
MTNAYKDSDPFDIKLKEESRCLRLIFKEIEEAAGQPYLEEKLLPGFMNELRLHRCLWERLLRVISESHFKDYQLEKFSSREMRD